MFNKQSDAESMDGAMHAMQAACNNNDVLPRSFFLRLRGLMMRGRLLLLLLLFVSEPVDASPSSLVTLELSLDKLHKEEELEEASGLSQNSTDPAEEAKWLA